MNQNPHQRFQQQVQQQQQQMRQQQMYAWQQQQQAGAASTERKSGCALFIQRAFTFLIMFVVTGAIFGFIAALIGGAIADSEQIAYLCGGAGLLVALVVAIGTAARVSPYK